MSEHHYVLHLGWFLAYAFILVGIFYGAEMYGVGAVKAWSFTENACAVAERVNWFGFLFMTFLTWLWIHFAIRIIPMLLGKSPMEWI